MLGMKHTFIMLPTQEEKIRNIFTDAKSFAVVSGDENSGRNLCWPKKLSLKQSETPDYPSIPIRKEKKTSPKKWRPILPSANNNHLHFFNLHIDTEK